MVEQNIGKRIVELRRKMGLTQEELAEKGDLTPQFISCAELGKRTMRSENLLKLSAALGVSADYLLTGECVEKDYCTVANKLNRLNPAQLKAVEAIIDELSKK